MLALVRTIAPHNAPWFSLVNFALGGWLIFAASVLGYLEDEDAAAATANDMAVGIVVVVMALSSAVSRYRYRRDLSRVDPERT